MVYDKRRILGKRAATSLLASNRVSVIKYAPIEGSYATMGFGSITDPISTTTENSTSVYPTTANQTTANPTTAYSTTHSYQSIASTSNTSNILRSDLLSPLKATVTIADTEPYMNWNLIENLGMTVSQKFRRDERKAIYQINHNLYNAADISEYKNLLDNAYERAMIEFFGHTNPNDYYCVLIETVDKRDTCSPIYLAPERINQFDKRRFIDKFNQVVQSNAEFLKDGRLQIRVSTYRAKDTVKGGGRSIRCAKTYDQTAYLKTSVVSIDNNNQGCGYIAIALGEKYHEFGVRHIGASQPDWKYLIKYENRKTAAGEQLVDKINETAGSDVLDFGTSMDFNALEKIQDYFRGQFQIIVVNYKTGYLEYVGIEAPKEIYLLFDPIKEHYSFIKSITSFKQHKYFCKIHCVSYDVGEHQYCGCDKCFEQKTCVPDTSETWLCNDCNREFYNNNCLNKHKDNNACKYYKYCMHCEINYKVNPKVAHVCFSYECHECKEVYAEQPHYCFMKVTNAERLQKQDEVNNIIVAFDIESMLVRESLTVQRHQPILLVANIVCNQCFSENIDFCVVCGDKEKVFEGTNCDKLFNDYVLNVVARDAEMNKSHVTVVAHNLSSYDGHFIFRDLCKRGIKDPEVIFKGTKMMKCDVGNVRYIDTLLLFQRPLCDLPKMFGIPDESKGFYPHHINTPENQGKSFLMSNLSRDDFGYKQMNKSRAQEFNIWFEANQTIEFDLNAEMLKYCRSDVTILLKSIMKFRNIFKNMTELDPISRTFTLASIGLEYFRTKVLKEKTIGVTPVNGYTNQRKSSHEANAWLDLMQEKYMHTIVREFRVGPYYADGFIQTFFTDTDGQTYDGVVFEYFGCYWHGCDCMTYNAVKQQAIEKKRLYYIRHNFKIEFTKSCEWKHACSAEDWDFYQKRVKYHKQMKDENLYCNPRKALHGGRTNNFIFSHIAQEGQTLKYFDITSLYPYVLNNCEFPFGHPKVITDVCDRETFPYFGFISCKVLPPKQLYFPVLPYHSYNKLVYPLCKTCADIKQNETCNHSNEERCLIGVFTTIDMKLALDRGYQIVECYEILNYEVRDNQTFKEYIKEWYTHKIQASGLPSNVNTPEEIVEYIEEIKNHEGIELEADQIEVNPGMRNIAKLMLNTLWGKFAQNVNQPQTVIVNNFTELHKYFEDPNIEILGDELIYESIILNYRLVSDDLAKPRNTAVAVAAMVTSYARKQLVETMEKLEESLPGSVLYCDTDSIVFVYKEGHFLPKILNFLGDWTDEIAGEFGVGAQMTEFHTIGPKCYSYKVVKADGSEVTTFKSKGITQTVESAEHINFNVIKDKATKKIDEIPQTTTLVPQMQFRANKQHEVATHMIQKNLNVTSDKRRIIGNQTLPYGWVDDEVDDFAALMTEMIE